jgi:hypothetical protein
MVKMQPKVLGSRWAQYMTPEIVVAAESRYRSGRHKRHVSFMEYRQLKRRAMPPWADRTAIAAIYLDARRRGLEVDHVVPLRHPLVCGLHVAANLQPTSSFDNRTKGNRWWPDMPN